MNGFIYKITNTINDKVYIGKTLSSVEKDLPSTKKIVVALKNKFVLYIER